MAAVEEHEGHAEAREGLDHRVKPRSRLDKGGGRPPQPVSRPGQEGYLVEFSGKRLDHSSSVDVFVHDHGHFGHPALCDPREGEDSVAQLLSENEDQWHGRHGDQGQGHVDAEHEPEGHQEAHDGEPGEWPEGQQELDGTDVRVGARDHLAGGHSVVEGE